MIKIGMCISGRYEIIEKVGAGGMADVYKGKDTMLNRYVAIKVLKKEYLNLDIEKNLTDLIYKIDEIQPQ